jgi:hypothetical protein
VIQEPKQQHRAGCSDSGSLLSFKRRPQDHILAVLSGEIVAVKLALPALPKRAILRLAMRRSGGSMSNHIREKVISTTKIMQAVAVDMPFTLRMAAQLESGPPGLTSEKLNARRIGVEPVGSIREDTREIVAAMTFEWSGRN